MSEPKPPPEHRPLLSTGGMFALIGCAALVLLVLLPLAQGRLQKAILLAPSSLSLRYLELSLAKRPEDRELRVQLVQKLLETGQLPEARKTLLPLVAAADQPAQLLLIELDRRAWAAIPPQRADERALALRQVLADMQAIAAESLPLAEQERFAKLYRELDQPLTAAELFEALARRDLPDAEARIRVADAAWLAAGKPERAAALQADLALRPAQTPAAGLAHARAAIERTRSTGDAAALKRVLGQMREAFPRDLGLLELEAKLAEEHDVERAYELTQQLVAAAPNDLDHRRKLARLAEATGRGLKALDAYVWLVRHGGDAHDYARAVELAKANWDLPLLRELLELRGGKAEPPAVSPRDPRKRTAAPEKRRNRARCQAAASRSQLQAVRRRAIYERVALDEALGDAAAARAKLTGASESELQDDSELWQRRFEFEQRQGDLQAQLVTATQMLQRFGGLSASERLASVQLALGQTQAALSTLLAAALTPEQRDEAWLRRIALLAFEAGDVAAERGAYEALIASAEGAAWDYQRLWELAPDQGAALRIALAAFERFQSPGMLAAALEIYRDRGDTNEVLALLERAEAVRALSERPGYWQTRISLHQERAALAAKQQDYSLAKAQLAEAERLLARAAEQAPGAPELYDGIRVSQSAQGLSLGLASDDMPLTARAYDDYGSRLSVREQVYVLRRLGRDDEALALARSALDRPDVNEKDRGVLEGDARALSTGIVRFARVMGDAVQMDGLRALKSGATLEYTGRAAGVRGDASFTYYEPRATAEPVLSAPARDVAASLAGRLSAVSLEAGARVRDERSVQPFGNAGVQFLGSPTEKGARGLARVHVNDAATDTTRLRALGMRQALVLDGAVPFGEYLYLSARGTAEAYFRREDYAYLGAGLSLDAGFGANFALPANAGAAGVRLAGRVAPRFARARDEARPAPGLERGWLPDTSEWAGLGASVGRGQLDVPPLIGRQFSYIVDGAAGMLWPQNAFGFSAQAGVGLSIFGADLLTLAARGGNVVGSTVWSANLGYGISIDR